MVSISFETLANSMCLGPGTELPYSAPTQPPPPPKKHPPGPKFYICVCVCVCTRTCVSTCMQVLTNEFIP